MPPLKDGSDRPELNLLTFRRLDAFPFNLRVSGFFFDRKWCYVYGKTNKTLHFHCDKTCKYLKANGLIRQLAKYRLSKYQVTVKQKLGIYLHFILLFLIQYYCKIQFTGFKTWEQPTFFTRLCQEFLRLKWLNDLDKYWKTFYGFSPWKTVGPRVYSRYIGSSAWADWPTFRPW